jgi:hypothetical protein
VKACDRCGVQFRPALGRTTCLECTDAVNPRHYREHPSGVECIAITEHMGFCLGNAVKYIWRAGLKSENPTEDLRKAIWYLERELARIARKGES